VDQKLVHLRLLHPTDRRGAGVRFFSSAVLKKLSRAYPQRSVNVQQLDTLEFICSSPFRALLCNIGPRPRLSENQRGAQHGGAPPRGYTQGIHPPNERGKGERQQPKYRPTSCQGQMEGLTFRDARVIAQVCLWDPKATLHSVCDTAVASTRRCRPRWCEGRALREVCRDAYQEPCSL